MPAGVAQKACGQARLVSPSSLTSIQLSVPLITPGVLQYVDPQGHWFDLHSLLLVKTVRRVVSQVSIASRYFIPAIP